jgi:peptidoglycan/xylan/chitin deacetylase (PgdA/CDA1 family)
MRARISLVLAVFLVCVGPATGVLGACGGADKDGSTAPVTTSPGDSNTTSLTAPPPLTTCPTDIPWATTTTGPGATSPSSTGVPRATTTTSAATTRPVDTTRPPTTAVPAPTTTLPRPTSSSTTEPSVPAGGLEYARLPGDAKRVALTFDAAYDTAPLPAILATLSEERIPATFFFTGEFVEDFPSSVAAVVRTGAPIGNHSFSHPDFTQITADAVREQLRSTARALTAAGAPDPRPLFRFPYGARDASTLALVGSEGYYSIFWTIDTLDWKADRTVDEIREAVRDRLVPGAIILMHVGGPRTAEALPLVISDIRARGYTFVDLRSALP